MQFTSSSFGLDQLSITALATGLSWLMETFFFLLQNITTRSYHPSSQWSAVWTDWPQWTGQDHTSEVDIQVGVKCCFLCCTAVAVSAAHGQK